MRVAVNLSSPHQVFTNLDHVAGTVNLLLPSPTNIVSVIVKLEGESITQLLAPPRDPMDEKPRPVQETHKILYITQQVFPSTQSTANASMLAPGNHVFPFNFKLPFNTMCHSNTNDMSLKSLPSFIKGTTAVTSGHIKSPLPPTLGGFPGLASIRYYVKATVNRREFYKENPRIVQNIAFVPIEPPRPPQSTSENFGRRTYQFSVLPPSEKPRLNKMFSDLKVKSRSSSATSIPATVHDADGGPRVEVDARLPEPAILTAQEPVPLRVLVTRLDDGNLPLYLQSLQVELVGTTNIRAGQFARTEGSSWILTSKSNLNQLLDFPTASSPEPATHTESRPFSVEKPPAVLDGSNTSTPSTVLPAEKGSLSSTPQPKLRRITLSSTPWQTPLASTIPPSFKTCNITRVYALEVRLGIGYSYSIRGPGNSAKCQIILPLRLQCQVWSGVRPPESLVTRVAKSHQAGLPPRKPLSNAAQANVATASSSSYAQGQTHLRHPTTGMAGPSNATAAQQPPPGFAPLPQGEEEPPPSYEDAMGIDLGPVDGPRNYRPVERPAAGDGFHGSAGGKG